jgi:hypothetical protein
MSHVLFSDYIEDECVISVCHKGGLSCHTDIGNVIYDDDEFVTVDVDSGSYIHLYTSEMVDLVEDDGFYFITDDDTPPEYDDDFIIVNQKYQNCSTNQDSSVIELKRVWPSSS